MATTRRTLHDVFAETSGQGAFGPDTLSANVLPGVIGDLGIVGRSRWVCNFYLDPQRTLDFDEFVGGQFVSYLGLDHCVSHPFTRAAQSYYIDRICAKIRGQSKTVLVVGTTYQEARDFFQACPGVDFRFLLGRGHPKDGFRLSKGLSSCAALALAADPLALDFQRVAGSGTPGRYFSFAEKVLDWPRASYDLIVAVDSFYDVNPEEVGGFLRDTSSGRVLFTLHCAAELEYVTRIANPVFEYHWEKRGKMAAMVFSDASQPYVHSWENLKKWWLQSHAPARESNWIWETVRFSYGYGLFEGYVEPCSHVLAQPCFFACQGKVIFICDVEDLLVRGQIVLLPVNQAKFDAVRQFIGAVLDTIDPQRIMQNIRSQLHRIVVGGRTLSSSWNLLDQDVQKIMLFVVLYTSLERKETGNVMRIVGQNIREGGYEANFYSIWVQLSWACESMERWLQSFGVLPAFLLYRLRQCVENPFKARYSFLIAEKATPTRPVVAFRTARARLLRGMPRAAPPVPKPVGLRAWLPAILAGGELSEEDEDSLERKRLLPGDCPESFHEYQLGVLGYERESADVKTHGAAKAVELLDFGQSILIHHFGVEPGGMLALMVERGYMGYAHCYRGEGGSGVRTLMPSKELFKGFVFDYIHSLTREDETIANITDASSSCFFFDCAHCSGCDVEDEILMNTAKIVASKRPLRFVLKCLTMDEELFRRVLSVLPFHYTLRLVSPSRSSPMSYETYLIGAPGFSLGRLLGYNPVINSFNSNRDRVYTNWCNYSIWLQTRPPAPELEEEEREVEEEHVPAEEADPTLGEFERAKVNEMKDTLERMFMGNDSIKVMEMKTVEAITLKETDFFDFGKTGAMIDILKAIPGVVEAPPKIEPVLRLLPEQVVPIPVPSPVERPDMTKDEEEAIEFRTSVAISALNKKEQAVKEQDVVQPLDKMISMLWADIIPPSEHYCFIEPDGMCFFRALAVAKGTCQEDWKESRSAFTRWRNDGKNYAEGWVAVPDILLFCKAQGLGYRIMDVSDPKGVSYFPPGPRSLWYGVLVITVKEKRAHVDVAVFRDHPFIRKPEDIQEKDLIWHEIDLYPNVAEPKFQFNQDKTYFADAMSRIEDKDMREAHEVVAKRLGTLSYGRRKMKIAFIHGKAGVGKSNFPKKLMKAHSVIYITATRVNRDTIAAEFFDENDISVLDRKKYHFKTLYHAFTTGIKLPYTAATTVIVDECCRNPYALLSVYGQAFPMANFILMGDPQQMGSTSKWFPGMERYIGLVDCLKAQGINLMDKKQVTFRGVSRRFGPKVIILLRRFCPQVEIYAASAKPFDLVPVQLHQEVEALYGADQLLNIINESALAWDLPEELSPKTVSGSQGASVEEVHFHFNLASVANLTSFPESLYVMLTRAKSRLCLVEKEKNAINSFMAIPENRKKRAAAGNRRYQGTRAGGLIGSNLDPNRPVMTTIGGNGLLKYEEFKVKVTKRGIRYVRGLDTAHVFELASKYHINKQPTIHAFSKLKKHPPLTKAKCSLGALNEWNIENPGHQNFAESMNFEAPKLLPCVVDGSNLISRVFHVTKPPVADSGKRHYSKSTIQAINTFMERYGDTQDALKHQNLHPLSKSMKDPKWLFDLSKKFFDVYIDPAKYEAMLNGPMHDEMLAEAWNEYARVAVYTRANANDTMAGMKNIVMGHLKQQIKSKGFAAAFNDKGGQPVAANEKLMNAVFSVAVRFVRAMISRTMKDKWLWADGKSAKEISEFAAMFQELFALMGDSVKFDATQTKNTRIGVLMVWAIFTNDYDILKYMLETKDGRKVFVRNIMTYISIAGQDSGAADTMTINITFSMTIVVLLVKETYMSGGMFNGDDWVVYSEFSTIPLDLKYYNAWFRNPMKLVTKDKIAEFCNYLFGRGHYCYNPLVAVMKISNKNVADAISSSAKWKEWRTGMRDLFTPYRENFLESCNLGSAWSGLPVEVISSMILELDAYCQMKHHEAVKQYRCSFDLEDVVAGGCLLNLPPKTKEPMPINKLYDASILTQTVGCRVKLHEMLFTLKQAPAVYNTRICGGVAHAPIFTTTVTVGGVSVSCTGAPSKQMSEAYAAYFILQEVGFPRPVSTDVRLPLGVAQDIVDYLKDFLGTMEHVSTYQQDLNSLLGKLKVLVPSGPVTATEVFLQRYSQAGGMPELEDLAEPKDMPDLKNLQQYEFAKKEPPAMRPNTLTLFSKDWGIKAEDRNAEMHAKNGNSKVCYSDKVTFLDKEGFTVLDIDPEDCGIKYYEGPFLNAGRHSNSPWRRSGGALVNLKSKTDPSLRATIKKVSCACHPDNDFYKVKTFKVSGIPPVVVNYNCLLCGHNFATYAFAKDKAAHDCKGKREAEADKHNKEMHALNGNTDNGEKKANKPSQKGRQAKKQASKEKNMKPKTQTRIAKKPARQTNSKRLEGAITRSAARMAPLRNLESDFMKVACALTMPEDFPAVRFSDDYTDIATALGSRLQSDVPMDMANDTATNGPFYPTNGELVMFLFRDYMNPAIVYMANNGTVDWQYDFLFGNPDDSGATGLPSYSQSLFVREDVYTYVPFVMGTLDTTISGVFTPHQNGYFAKQDSDGLKYMWLDAGGELNITMGTRPISSNTYSVFVDRWTTEGLDQSGEEILLTNVSPTVTPRTINTPGYYAVRVKGAGMSGNCVFSFNFRSDKGSFGHWTTPGLIDNIASMGPVRILANAMRFMNTANYTAKNGDWLGVVVPETVHWQTLATSGFAGLNSYPQKIEKVNTKGSYSIIKPSGEKDLFFKTRHTTANGILTGSLNPIVSESPTTVFVLSIPELTGRAGRLIHTMNIEFQTTNQWFPSQIPELSTDAWRGGVNLVKRVPHTYENPTHVGNFFKSLWRGAKTAAGAVVKYAPVVAEAAAMFA